MKKLVSRVREPGRDLRPKRALRARGADLRVWPGRDIIYMKEFITDEIRGIYFTEFGICGVRVWDFNVFKFRYKLNYL